MKTNITNLKIADEEFLFDTTNLLQVANRLVDKGNWQDKYRNIMLLGKHIPLLKEPFRTDDAQIEGCESLIWLHHREINHRHYYLVDSDARIVKGLAALIVSQVQGKAADEITHFNGESFFERLAIKSQLSVSRINGISALVTKIRSMVI